MNTATLPEPLTPAQVAKAEAAAAKEAEAQKVKDEAIQKKLRQDTPDVKDGRQRQIGHELGGKEVVAVRYQEDDKGNRHSFVYILDDGTEASEKK